MKQALCFLAFFLAYSLAGRAQAEFYSIQPLGDRYIYNSDYFEDAREIQVYKSGVDATLVSDSLLVIYVFDAQYPPTFNLFCSTFEMTYPGAPCLIVGISNLNRQSELTPPYTDFNSVKGYDDPGKADSLLLSLKNELMPFVKSKYHASSRNVLVGHSLGGTFVTYAQSLYPCLFPCILAISPNYQYSERMMLDKLTRFAESYQDSRPLYIYLAHGRKDRMEEAFKPGIQEAARILSGRSNIILKYDSLNIEKHSHTIVEGFYRGLMSVNNYINPVDK